MAEKRGFRWVILGGLALFFVVVFLVVLILNTRSTRKSDALLEESIKDHLLATARAALILVDIEEQSTYKTPEDQQKPNYIATHKRLQDYMIQMNVTGLYTLRRDAAGNYFFIMDTDPTSEAAPCGTPYRLGASSRKVFDEGFAGKESVGINNVRDEYGNFSTAAVPLALEDGTVLGVLGIDLDDTPLTNQRNMRRINNVILYTSLAALFLIMLLVIGRMLNKNYKMSRKIAVQEERYRMAVAAASDAILDYQVTAGRIYIGRPLFRMLGHEQPESDGDILLIEDFYRMLGEENGRLLREHTLKMESHETDLIDKELPVRHPEGRVIWINIRGKAMYNLAGNQLVRITGSATEITLRKDLETEINTRAYYDSLTKLPNRAFLYETLAELTRKKPLSVFALYFIDLDNFKSVNDTKGHDAGDNLLRTVASFLRTALGDGDMAYQPAGIAANIAARFGGDEFVVVHTGVADEAEALSFARKMLCRFRTSPLTESVRQDNVSMSVGIAVYPDHADRDDQLLKCADIAMYHAKKHGKNQLQMYNETLK